MSAPHTATARPPDIRTRDAVFNRIAHHEAAHAVGALRTDGRVISVHIRLTPDGGADGLTHMEHSADDEGFRGAALASLAGLIGERQWLQHNDLLTAAHTSEIDRDITGDIPNAQDCLNRIPRERRPSLHVVQRAAEVLVARHWDHIADLAARLRTDRELRHITR
ncbi:hypothetical protein [Umezawaea beigongshangensis]|uniref:hypothetical protein n=1 Tax=Umezawaea beigongshangensis TaxID=2780383 RepID=UPI0018F159C4|nr:hypothetical protein [Umezawaea beigongshangensis]